MQELEFALEVFREVRDKCLLEYGSRPQANGALAAANGGLANGGGAAGQQQHGGVNGRVAHLVKA